MNAQPGGEGSPPNAGRGGADGPGSGLEARIEEAKNVLMRSRSISEAKAYDLLREQAMSKRVSIEEIAQTIVNANEILSLGKT